MIDYSNDDIHDIEHFMKVCAYTKTIGELEQPDNETQLSWRLLQLCMTSPILYAGRNTGTPTEYTMRWKGLLWSLISRKTATCVMRRITYNRFRKF